MFPGTNTNISYFLDSIEMMDIVHLIDDISVSLILVSTSVLTHDIE